MMMTASSNVSKTLRGRSKLSSRTWFSAGPPEHTRMLATSNPMPNKMRKHHQCRSIPSSTTTTNNNQILPTFSPA